MTLRWEKFPYGARGEFADVPGLGRYSIRPEAKGSRTWRAYFNAQRTKYAGTRDECKDSVERCVRQYDLGKSSREEITE